MALDPKQLAVAAAKIFIEGTREVAATNQLEAPSRIRQVRRTIAQIKTLQSERAAKAAASKA